MDQEFTLSFSSATSVSSQTSSINAFDNAKTINKKDSYHNVANRYKSKRNVHYQWQTKQNEILNQAFLRNKSNDI